METSTFLLVILSCLGGICYITSQSLPSCSSPIYCEGPLLETIQMARIFPDSKTFVDLKQRNDTSTTLKNFEKFINKSSSNNLSKEQIEQFVYDNFMEGNELANWTAPDFNTNPPFLKDIKDPIVKNFAHSLVNIWPTLARTVKPEVKQNPAQYSLIPVPNGFIIPGGRFKEFYYWDSYWIIKGLLVSGMVETTKGMLENFLYMVEHYGFVPNGGRIYYLNRSQPPLLCMMVDLYIKETGDLEWLQRNIKTIEKELYFWLHNRISRVQKDGVEYQLAHYDVESGTPRPESYVEDVGTCSLRKTASDIKQCYADLKSGAESGWDFSSRWIFDESGGSDAPLVNIQTRRVIPVDLNAFLAKAFLTLSKFHNKLGYSGRQKFWRHRYLSWRKSISEVLYNEKDGIWYDYDAKSAKQRVRFSPSNFAPLWAEIYDQTVARRFGEAAAAYLEREDILKFQGGIPTSLVDTGEQWDLPNAWPPLQAIVILGLDRSGARNARRHARTLALRWIRANMIGFNSSNEMFEKYDALVPGKYGGGGEYTVQSGFGWTNGVILELIEKYFLTSN